MEGIWVIAYTYAFVVGICVASFMNVVVYRVPLKISVAKGRSFCPKCNHSLNALDLIPVLGYFLLGRKCRYCKEPISFRYPLVEMIGGLLSMLCLYRYGFTMMTIYAFLILMVLLCVTLIDLDTMTIPNGLLLWLLAISLVVSFTNTDISLTDRLIGFLAVSAPMYALDMLIPDCFGGGDIKLMAVSGVLLGWVHILLAMFIGVILGGFVAVYLLLNKKVERQMHIAFGPYLAIGIACALLYGETILSAYFSLFGM